MDTPFARTLARFGLTPEEAADLVAAHGVSERLIFELIHLASVKYRTLDRWGQKSAFEREVGDWITLAAQERGLG